LIVATIRNLDEEVKRGNFREDLYYRLNVVKIVVPSLRERKEDIPLLMDFFVKKYRRQVQEKHRGFTRESRDHS
jgi:DNA-binding NtrC family response regulator